MLGLYRQTLEIRNYRPSSLKKNLQFATKFLNWVNPENTGDINAASVEDYLIALHHAGRSPKTIKNHRSGIKAFCDFLIMRGLLNDNPVAKAPSIDLPIEIPVFLTDPEIDQAYEISQKDKIYCEICLALNTGLRMSELRNLEWRDIDLDNRQLIVRKSKGKRPRTVPLNQKASNALLMQQKKIGGLVYVFPGGRGGPGQKGLWNVPKKRGQDWWARIALVNIQDQIQTLNNMPKGRTGRGWHAFRHTFATRAAKCGIDVFKLKDWMGHRKIETTMRYIHLARHYDPDIELI